MPFTLSSAWTTTKKIVAAFWKFFSAVLLVLLGTAAYFYDFKKTDVSVEITAVTTGSSDLIDIMRISELSSLRSIIKRDISFLLMNSKDPGALSVDEIDRHVGIAIGNAVAQSSELDKQKNQFSTLLANSAVQEVPLLDLLSALGENRSTAEGEIKAGDTDSLIKKIRKSIEEREKRAAAVIGKAREAEKQWESYKRDILPTRSRLIVTCAIGNSGAGATSLKPQGLLRANLGDGNYLDLPMKMSGYEVSADLAALHPRSQKVVRYQSEELQAMTATDTQRFKTFLGNVSPATLFVTDVRGKTYASNSVPFSPGVYEQKVYDSLKQFASKHDPGK